MQEPEWRVKLTRPGAHDGRWAWSLEKRQPTKTRTDELGIERIADPPWSRVTKHTDGPFTHGSGTTFDAAIAMAGEAKQWYEKQEHHETQATTMDVELK